MESEERVVWAMSMQWCRCASPKLYAGSPGGKRRRATIGSSELELQPEPLVVYVPSNECMWDRSV